MKIVTVIDRDLTEAEIASIERFRSYTDGVSFACLREGVMAMLHDEPSKDADTLRQKAIDRMEYALCHHPDMECMQMDDGHRMVFLPSGIFTFTKTPCSDNGMVTNLILRQACLDACEAGEVIAVAYEEG